MQFNFQFNRGKSMTNKPIIGIFEATFSLVGGQMTWGDGEVIFHDGQTQPTEAEIQTEIARLQASYDALDYARKRQAEYPDYGTQLNKIYDDGLTKWKSEMVDPVKAKYPKP